MCWLFLLSASVLLFVCLFTLVEFRSIILATQMIEFCLVFLLQTKRFGCVGFGLHYPYPPKKVWKTLFPKELLNVFQLGMLGWINIKSVGLHSDLMEYYSLWELILVCVGVAVKRTMYQRKVDVDMLNAVKSVLADILSASPSSEQRAALWSVNAPWVCMYYYKLHTNLEVVPIDKSGRHEVHYYGW